MKKKRTVITTEKCEVWVIRQPTVETEELDTDSKESESADSITRLPNHGETDAPSD